MGVALILFAAVDKVGGKGGVALLLDVFGETSPLLNTLHPGVETDVSSAGSICASAFVILACTQQLFIIFSV